MNYSIIILVYNEERHLKRVLENAQNLSDDIHIIDSNSTDNSREIISHFSLINYHNYVGEESFYSKFNRALTEIIFKYNFVFRLDADEFISVELNYEIETLDASSTFTAFTVNKRSSFLSDSLKYSKGCLNEIRLFRPEFYKFEHRLVDEMLIFSGYGIETVGNLKNELNEDSILNLEEWVLKHIKYAARDALELERERFFPSGGFINQKQLLRFGYSNLPLFIRSFLYLKIRVLLRPLFFLDGYKGLRYVLLHHFFYRILVDSFCFNYRFNKLVKNSYEEI
jgi:glycosyltransferase involved in cell wall biosynthesis